MTEIWAIAQLAVAAFCFARGIVDLRQRRFAWGALGMLSGIIIMTTPIQTHAVKYDLPWPANSQG
jgi:hypothetical protein